MLDQVLRREEKERVGQPPRLAVDRHLALRHRLEERGLGLWHRPVDLVDEHDVREDRSGRNSNSRRRWSNTERPVTSVGRRSGVHWTRARSAPATLPAIALASTVFAVPGTSSSRTWPSHARAVRTSPTSSRLPWITVSTLSSRRVASAGPSASRRARRSGACPLSVLAVSVRHSSPRHDLLETTSSVVVKRTPRSRHSARHAATRSSDSPRAASSTKATA